MNIYIHIKHRCKIVFPEYVVINIGKLLLLYQYDGTTKYNEEQYYILNMYQYSVNAHQSIPCYLLIMYFRNMQWISSRIMFRLKIQEFGAHFQIVLYKHIYLFLK